MLKILKYYKPYIIALFTAIVLLFIQAMCDLNLPNYMAKIVNTGIQSSGIENELPDAISSNGFNLVSKFLVGEEKESFKEGYTKIDKNNSEYISIYPFVKENEIYVLNDIGRDNIESLSRIYSVSIRTLLNTITSFMATTDLSTQDNTQMDINNLYNIIPMLNNIPVSVIEEAREKTLQEEPIIVSQVATAFTKLFYEELELNISKLQTNYIIKVGTQMILITLVGATAIIIVSFISSKIAAGVSQKLRRDLFLKVKSFSNKEFDKFSTASLITRTTNDITQIQSFTVMGIRMLFYAPIMAIGGVFMIYERNSNMTWILYLACSLIFVIILFVFLVALPKFKIIQKLVDKLNLVSRENLTGLMVSRAFGTEEYESNKFDKANLDLTKVSLFVNRIMVLMLPTMMLIMNIVSILIIWVGAHQIAESQMQVGDMIAFIQYAMQVIMSFLMMSIMFIIIPRASVSADRIAEVLNTDLSIKDKKLSKTFDKNKIGYVEFQNVDFRFDAAEENVLENISFTAKPGTTTAFVGSTGSGKTTLINLIPRFYDVTKGKILVNGVDVRDIKLEELYAQIGYIPQKPSVFSGTINSNLKYGKEDATDKYIADCVEASELKEYINSKEEKYEMEVSQNGKNLSGGQKQRLSIARALVKESPIYIFDDSFSALDLKTDKKIRKALKTYVKDSTVLIVAQRINTIKDADQIVVLENGRIVGKGTHKELLKDCNVYLEIASSQMSKEELENE